jgi:hypothetical protein
VCALFLCCIFLVKFTSFVANGLASSRPDGLIWQHSCVMADSIEMQASAVPSNHEDSLLVGVELPLKAMYYPLGFPMELATNSREVIEAASQSWGLFAKSFDEPPVRISLGVAESGGAQLPPRPRFRSRGHLMSIISNPDNFIVCDFSRGCAFGWVTRRVVAHSAFLRRHFLEAAAWTVIEQLHLAAVHGALIAQGDCGVLLCGETFAGKSTLAYACARAGWTLISDDGTFLRRNRTDCYGVGNPYSLHLRSDAKHLFPELTGRPVTTRPGGKIGMEVPTQELPIRIATGSPIEHVVFLRRSDGAGVHLEKYSSEETMAWLESHAFFGEDHVQAEQRQSYARLLRANVWEMRYRDLNEALHRLERLASAGV